MSRSRLSGRTSRKGYLKPGLQQIGCATFGVEKTFGKVFADKCLDALIPVGGQSDIHWGEPAPLGRDSVMKALQRRDVRHTALDYRCNTWSSARG